MHKLPPTRYQTFINATPKSIYAAISTGVGWDAWFTTKATVDKERMFYRFYWENFGGERETVSQEGRIIHADPDWRFGLEWQTAKDDSRTVAMFTITPRSSGAIVEVREEGYMWDERDIRVSMSCAGGWAEALTLLKFFLEHGLVYGDVPKD